MLGALLSLASALSFSVNAILVRRGIAGAGATASQGTFITVLLGVPFGLITVLITGQILRFGEVSPDAYLLLAGAGVVHFGAGRYCNYRAIGAIGASRSGPVQTLVIPYSILMAVVLLGETVNAIMGVGILLILLGPTVMIERRPYRRQRADPDPTGGAPCHPAPAVHRVEIRQLEGYLFAMLAALAYGTSPILIRAALGGATGTAAIGTFVAYVGASVVILFTLVLPGRRELVSAITPRYLRLFGGAGLAVFMAQLLRFYALSLADVSLVSPLQRMATVFTLILSFRLNPSIEHITPRVVLGVLVSFVGSALLIVGGTA